MKPQAASAHPLAESFAACNKGTQPPVTALILAFARMISLGQLCPGFPGQLYRVAPAQAGVQHCQVWQRIGVVVRK